MRLRKRTRSTKFSYDNLESRQLLAGNVFASVDGGVLLLVGDAQSNQVVISQNDSGNFVVTGNDTTVNGNASITADASSTFITVALQSGNDELTIDGINVAKNISFYGGDGADRMVAKNSFAYHFHAEGGGGDDVFDLELTTRKSAYVYLGEGNDVLFASQLHAGRNLKIFGGEGNDTIVTETLGVGRKLEIQLGAGNDNVLMSGQTTVGRSSKFDLGAGNDFAAALPDSSLTSADLGRRVWVTGGEGDDALAIDSSVTFNNASVRGGAGIDSVQSNSNSRSRVVGFENPTVSNLSTLVDAVLARLAAVNVGDVETSPLSATASTDTLTIGEGQNPVSPDDAITVTGSGFVTGAEIEIGNFSTGVEELTFVDTSAITGSFNGTTGVMTLTGNASTSAYQVALRSLRYQNTSQDPVSTRRQFTFTATTADENVSVTRDFEVVPVNDAPIIDFETAQRTLIPDGNPVLIDSALSVTDVDNAELVSAVVALANGFVSGEDVLASGTFTGIVPTFDASTGALTLSGTNIDVSTWEDVLQSITYNNTASTPTLGERTIRFTVSDGTAQGTNDFALTINADTTQPNSFTVQENASNGDVVGQITTTAAFSSDSVYQRSDISGAQQLLINTDDHRSGEATAPVVLIEYLDFQCPICRAYHSDVQTLKQTFGDELLVITRHFPLEQIHSNARAAAVVSEAAAAQGMFDEMADLLFTNQADWSSLSDPTSIFESYAQIIGLNLTQFRSDVQDTSLDARVTRDLNDATALNATGTPAFFLEESQISNPASLAAFDSSIQSAIDSVNSPFQVNLETGQVTVRDSSLLDASADPTVNVPVIVTASAGTTESINVTINVIS